MDSGVTLTYEDRRVVDDWRFSVVRPYLREWNLQIRDVQWPDQDMYRCTINTTPVKSKIVSLHVKVPAQIIDELSSDDVIVEEGETVVLVCNVTGVPRPEVTWFRRSAGSSGSAPGHKEPIGLDMVGEMIIIQNVSRYCDDYYECVANNGVPPAVNREIRVTVEFPPEIHMPTPKISQYIGKDTILDCVITAFPQANNVWKKDGREISSNSRFRISAYEEGDNTLTLSLRIHSIRHSDYGEYTCEASNALGKDEQKTILSEIKDFQPPINPEGSGNPIVIPMTPGTKPPSHNNHNTYPGYNTDEQKPSPHKDPGSAGNEDSSQSHGNRGSKPEVDMPMRRIGQLLGRDAILSCMVTAFPEADIAWTKDGRSIGENGRCEIDLFDDGHNTTIADLHIHDIQQCDYGEYTCEAANVMGVDAKSATLFEVKG
ncbi:hypothetical protein CAPTEDRAFT_150259 [Capitella teleta]|uniref:Ig-like domain-containing protein n=1 Tax=Capitella teleta TaxID=283909 RepID=R7T4U1_CAPTE|nr:hypothetical protein CAPTEDRAFT_150259 [Capitella teleta]|eukprot:ELT87911.1 hypothetical protein CAPTEDRAFT_150259 [Capitella teleta]